MINLKNSKDYKIILLGTNMFQNKEKTQSYFMTTFVVEDDKKFTLLTINNEEVYNSMVDEEQCSIFTLEAIKTFDAERKPKYNVIGIR